MLSVKRLVELLPECVEPCRCQEFLIPLEASWKLIQKLNRELQDADCDVFLKVHQKYGIECQDCHGRGWTLTEKGVAIKQVLTEEKTLE